MCWRLVRNVWQVQVNLRAVIGDVRAEVGVFSQATASRPARKDLAARTEDQASSLQETAASMEQLASTVQQTADAARQIAAQSQQSSDISPNKGSTAVGSANASMQAIEASSRRMEDIIGIIESIAFQTNIPA